MDTVNLRFKYYMNGVIVKNLELCIGEIAFKNILLSFLLELPYQLYICENNYWEWSDLKDYEFDSLILALKGINSNIYIEVSKN